MNIEKKVRELLTKEYEYDFDSEVWTDSEVSNMQTIIEATEKVLSNHYVLHSISNRYVVCKTVMDRYIHLETTWSDDYLKKKGYEVVDFYNNRESAISECNRLNAE